jgi:hypothetical protein
MNLYSVALFVHIVGAVLLFVLLTVEGVGLRVGFSSAAANRILGPISVLGVLVPGLYMMKAVWGVTGWVAIGIAAWVLIAVVGAFTGISVMRGRMSNRAATVSWLVRIGMALAVVFDMTVKPNVMAAAGVVIVGALLGAATSLVRRREVAAI